LEIETYALYTPDDATHTLNATHAVALSSPASYLDISELLAVVKHHKIDAIHPGYGFLSESAEFVQRMWEDANAVVVGPGWGILARTGDKLQARVLAEECAVPVLPAMSRPTDEVSLIRDFAAKVGYPIIIKAVDGGGGRGIRIVRKEEDLESLMGRALKESPCRMVFAEKAAIEGYRHVEVQIVGDGKGAIRHLWERECSIQRRFQKVVEFAPSSIGDRELVGRVIEAALRMAKKVSCHFLHLDTARNSGLMFYRSIICLWAHLSSSSGHHRRNFTFSKSIPACRSNILSLSPSAMASTLFKSNSRSPVEQVSPLSHPLTNFPHLLYHHLYCVPSNYVSRQRIHLKIGP
jgi:biotin carboxylase